MRGHNAEAYLHSSDNYISDVRRACLIIQGCSNQLSQGLATVQSSIASTGDVPVQQDVRASFVDALKHLSIHHGPSDSLFIDKGSECRTDGPNRWTAFGHQSGIDVLPSQHIKPNVLDGDRFSGAQRNSAILQSISSPQTPRSQSLSDQARCTGSVGELSPKLPDRSRDTRPPCLQISPSKSFCSPSDDTPLVCQARASTGNPMFSSMHSPITPGSRVRPGTSVAPSSPLSVSPLSLPTPSYHHHRSPATPPQLGKHVSASLTAPLRPATAHGCSGEDSEGLICKDTRSRFGELTSSVGITRPKTSPITSNHSDFMKHSTAKPKPAFGSNSNNSGALHSSIAFGMAPGSAGVTLSAKNRCGLAHSSSAVSLDGSTSVAKVVHQGNAQPTTPPSHKYNNSAATDVPQVVKTQISQTCLYDLQQYSQRHSAIDPMGNSATQAAGKTRDPVLKSNLKDEKSIDATAWPSRKKLGWGKGSNASANTNSANAFHLLTASPLAESASRMCGEQP